MATALIGRAVTIQVASGTVEGIVSMVKLDEGLPKVIVDGTEYALGQVLTSAPSEVAQPKAPSAG